MDRNYKVVTVTPASLPGGLLFEANDRDGCGGAVSERARFGLRLVWLMKYVVILLCVLLAVDRGKAFQQIMKVTEI